MVYIEREALPLRRGRLGELTWSVSCWDLNLNRSEQVGGAALAFPASEA